jgi:hypothetical protein
MVVILMLAAFARQGATAPRRVVTVAVHAGIAGAAAWLALWQSGSLMVPASSGLAVGGFGQFSANLLTFVMPTEWRTLLTPGLFGYADSLQYEGYAYLGLGALLLGASVIVASAASGQWRPSGGSLRRHLALVAAVSVLALMAVGPTITAGRMVLFEYDPRWWGPFTIFRTSGRMIWPLFYATLTAILFRAARFRYSTAVALLSVAVALQAVDLAGMSRFVGEVGVRGVRDPLNSPFWRVVPGHYERLILVPSNLCGRDGAVDATPFLMIAARERLPINAGATARYDMQRAADYCEVLAADVRAGVATPGSLYVIRGDLLPRVAPQAEANGSTCISVDGFGVCYVAESARAWQDAFAVTAEHRWH